MCSDDARGLGLGRETPAARRSWPHRRRTTSTRRVVARPARRRRPLTRTSLPLAVSLGVTVEVAGGPGDRRLGGPGPPGGGGYSRRRRGLAGLGPRVRVSACPAAGRASIPPAPGPAAASPRSAAAPEPGSCAPPSPAVAFRSDHCRRPPVVFGPPGAREARPPALAPL
jgi:hypothetical protein